MASRPGSAASQVSRRAWDQQTSPAPDPEALYTAAETPTRRDSEADVVALEEKDSCWYMCTSRIRGLWATRMTEDTKADPELYVRTTLRELVIYIVFLIILSVLTFGMTSVNMYYYTKVMSQLFLDQAFNITMNNFRGANHPDDFWRFVEGPLMDGLYWEEHYNEKAAAEIGYIYFENKILGVPRMRQLKVRNDSCAVHEDFANEIPLCYAPYSKQLEQQDNLAPVAANLTRQPLDVKNNDSPYFYYSEEELGGSSHWGLVSTYGGGGYVQDLGKRRADTELLLEDLKANLWLDRGTRAVMFDFTVYNANINLFCVVKLVMEFPATGGLVPSWSFRTVKLIRYVTVSDYFILACELMFALFILYYTIEECIEIKKHKFKYFRTFWNILDVLVILISMVCIAFSVYRVQAVNDTLQGLLERGDQFADFEFLGFWQTQFNNAVAVTIFFAWIKTFKYISFNKTMTQLSSTLSRCGKDIGGFLVMFAIIFFAFGQLGYLVFGTQVRDFSSFGNAVFSLLRIVLGDFDFHELERANRVLGPLYFISYVFFVFFVLLNMFLAIINDTYSEVKAELALQKNEFEIGDYFKQGYKRMVARLTSKRDKIVDIQEALKTADANGDRILNFEEWRQELKSRGYTESEIESVFAKYDVDGDRQLSEEEQRQMMADLTHQKESINEEIKQQDKKAELNDAAGGAVAMQGGVPPEEFDVLTRRVDRMEGSIGSIVTKIDAVLVKLEAMEKAKVKHKEKINKALHDIGEDQTMSELEKREAMEAIVKDELDKWDNDSGVASRPGSHGSSLQSTSQA